VNRSSKRLAHAHELLDGPLADAPVLRDNLRDLGRANRWTGGTDLSRQAIDALAPPPLAISVLNARRQGRALTVTAVDLRSEVLAAARAANPALDHTPGLTLDVADGRSLPYSDGSFDVVHASLVLHHLEPDEAVAFLREMGRVSRLGVVINDLGRAPITLFGAWLLSHACTRNAFSRHDASLSARRAYTKEEVIELLWQAGLRPRYSRESIFRHRWAMAAVRR
jgi:hypothetical protein